MSIAEGSGPVATGRAGPTRRSAPAVFWLIVPGLALVGLALTEGSAVWGAFIAASAYLGLASGLASGDAVLATVRAGAEGGRKPATGDVVRGAFSARNVLLFWAPQLLFWYASVQVALALPPESAPRSLRDTRALVQLEAFATYFVSVGAAWYKTWQWRRTLPRG